MNNNTSKQIWINVVSNLFTQVIIWIIGIALSGILLSSIFIRTLNLFFKSNWILLVLLIVLVVLIFIVIVFGINYRRKYRYYDMSNKFTDHNYYYVDGNYKVFQFSTNEKFYFKIFLRTDYLGRVLYIEHPIVKGPICLKHEADLKPIFNKLTKKFSYFYCSIDQEKIYIPKIQIKDFWENIENEVKSYLRKNKEQILSD